MGDKKVEESLKGIDMQQKPLAGLEPVALQFVAGILTPKQLECPKESHSQ